MLAVPDMRAKIARFRMRQGDLARELGLTDKTLSLLLNGHRPISPDVHQRLSDLIEVRAQALAEAGRIRDEAEERAQRLLAEAGFPIDREPAAA
ncbi:MAG: helix-turn-helix domain-containing protein [Dehalococcoidia bacterium]|nr:helix-turn-helix domain-containing protein [Dehalococcoidia bacterium]